MATCRHSDAKSIRHSVFATFITTTLLPCPSPSPVLDVAGGKGHLAAALRELNQPSILIDPCAETGRSQLVFYPPTGPTSLCQPTSLLSPLLELPPTLKTTLSAALTSHPTLALTSSCLVGLHPDEATEQIITTALYHRKPFAVIPCCVLPDLFNRAIDNKTFKAKTVRKMGTFLAYLKALDAAGRMRTVTLDFPGRNTVLYMSAEHYLTPPPHHVNAAAAEAASKRGDIATLIILREAGADFSEECCQKAAWSGQLETLIWLREVQGCEWGRSTCEGARKAERWEVLRYAVAEKCPGWAEFELECKQIPVA